MTWKRAGNGILALGGLALAALMVYSLVHDSATGNSWVVWGSPRATAEVVVFFPERPLWHEFVQGVDACVRRNVARLVGKGEEWVEVDTPRYGHRIRFVLNDVRGVRETKEAVDRIVKRPRPPVAIVGSSNTVLTVALAEALRRAEREERSGPLLLVPWATAVLTERAEPGHGPVALLDIDPDRTFRFCPNDQSQANLLTRALLHYDRGARPKRVDAVVDRSDPYSVDMADSFHRAIERLLPNTELVEHAESIQFPTLWNVPPLPVAAEEALAESIWRAADRAPAGATHWVVLPLQAEPARQLLLALRRHAPAHTSAGKPAPLRVLSGDGIGLDMLTLFAGQLPFPVFCYSAGLAHGGDEGRAPDPVLSTDKAVLAEVVAAVVHGLDVNEPNALSADGLRDRLRGFDLPADNPATLGRPIAFTPSGERVGEGLGHVLLIQPDSSSVFAMAEDASGEWSAPRPVVTGSGAAPP